MAGAIVVADPLAAVCAFLQASLGSMLTRVPRGLDGLRAGMPAVFRPTMPRAFDQAMPASCIVVTRAGGYQRFGRGQLPLGDPRLDVICYGGSLLDAEQLAQAAIVACKRLVMERWENAMLHSIDIAGGPFPLPDAVTIWPAYFLAVSVLHGELPSGV